MDLFLRKVIHPQARDNYRVIVKDEGVDIEVGSIGVQFDGWLWGIDNIVPMSEAGGEGSGKDCKDCMRKFRAAWDRFSADPALSEFLDTKRQRLMIKRAPPELPPEVARRFFAVMSAFHRSSANTNRSTG